MLIVSSYQILMSARSRLKEAVIMAVSIPQEVSDALVDQGFVLYLMGKHASVSIAFTSRCNC